MNTTHRTQSSEYMHWAKTLQAARFNLANSGVYAYPLRELPFRMEDLELCGPSFYGWPPLQAALSKHLRVASESIVHAVGTSLANHLAMAVCLEPGDDVLIEQPTYELLISTAQYLGANVRRLPRRFEGKFGIDLKVLEQSLTPRTRLIVLTNLHNPSSALLDRATILAVSELAKSVGARVLIDEVYLDAVALAGAQDNRPALTTAFGLADNILVTSSLTKVYGLNGLRCGWVLAEPELAQRMWRLNDLFGVIPAHPAERLSVLVFENFERVLGRSRALLNANRALLNQFLASRDDLESWPLEAGTVTFPRLRSGKVQQLCDVLRQKYEATVVPGRFFEMPDHIRIGIGAPGEITAEGLQRLGKALDDIR
jgi:aspartate/methionine/tyrosine aminotransferase